MTNQTYRYGWVLRYALALGAVAAGLLLRLAVTAWIGHGLPTYITFYPSVMAAALLGGLGPGLLATALAACVVDFWLLPPDGFGIAGLMDAVGLGLFSIMGVAISVVVEMYRRMRERLSDLVAERTRELSDANDALSRINTDLEQRVAAQTADLRAVNETLEHRVAERTMEVNAANKALRESRLAALNLMDDAVAARKRSEEISAELRRERDFTAAVLDNTGVIVVVLDKDGRIARFNRACETITGHASGEVLGRVFWEFLVPSEEMHGVMRTWAALRAGDFPGEHENHWLTKDGSRRLIAWFNTAILSPDGGVEYVISTGVDVTERRIAEEALIHSREDLKRAQAVASTGSWRLDVRKNELVWSDENWHIFGLPEGTPLTYETFLSTVHPDDRAYVQAKWSACLRGEPYDVEHRIVVDGIVKWVHERGGLELDENRTILGGFGTTQDITERKKVEETLRLATVELERSNRDLEQFAYVTSHDLKEPLRMVTSFMGLLKTRYADKLDDKAREYIGFAEEGGTRMQSLVDDLLAYSRVGRQGMTEFVGARAAVDRALINLRTAITESGARIDCGPMPTVRANGVELAQVFQNLIGNAIKFRRRGVPPEVDVSARMVQEMTGSGKKVFGDGGEPVVSEANGMSPGVPPTVWRFAVRDNGIGIDPKYHNRLFQIFQRLHTRDEYPGSGVGLAICKKIVERYGGEIWVESEEGKGCTVLFTLPDKGFE